MRGAILLSALKYGCDLTGGLIEPHDRTVPSAAIHEIGIGRIGSDKGVFKAANRVPILSENLAIVASAQNARGPAVLLGCINTIRKRVVGGDVIKLPRRLVIPGAPRPAAIDADDGPLVHTQNHARRIFGINPKDVKVISAGGTNVSFEGLSTVCGAVERRLRQRRERRDDWDQRKPG